MVFCLGSTQQNRNGLLLVSGLGGASFGALRPKLEQLLGETGLEVANILAVQLFVRDLRNVGKEPPAAVTRVLSGFFNPLFL